MTSERQWREGGCHCEAVRFRVRDDFRFVDRCNCSICVKKGYLHLILRAEDFALIRGEEALTEYRFNTGVARHLFCKICGVAPYYIPRSHPDGFDVNARCLDDQDLVAAMEQRPFDGADWEAHIDEIKGYDR